MTGNLGYFTVPVADMARGKAFYGGLFGWQFGPEANDQYAHVDNTTPPGGLHRSDAAAPQVWFKVADINAAVARVRELGGQADEPAESPSGWSAACRDDQGAQLNLWQPATGY